MTEQGTAKEVVIPGDLVDDSGQLRPGANTYKEGNRIYAMRLGLKAVRGDTVNVISLSGRYDPQRGDMVIGTVVETGPSNWYISIGAPSDVGMHVNDVPWRVDFGETAKFLNTGDTVLIKIFHVDEIKKVQVTMKDRQCRKLTGGLVFEVAPSKVARIVGRNGSMIGLVKNATSTRMFVGQNGVIWIDGEPADVALATACIRKIEAEAHLSGLTDSIKALLADAKGWEVVERAEKLAQEQREQEERESREEPRGGYGQGDRGDRRGGGGFRGGDRRGGGGRDRRGGGGYRGGDRRGGGGRDRRGGGGFRGGDRRSGGNRGPPRDNQEGSGGEGQ
ncbi:MAG: hypothetical protein HY556_01790 [Euryarchaeota archaeon]|nr:hypothetical protein [Euryarchaeota archaeon]